jgi:hypothetical protein
MWSDLCNQGCAFRRWCNENGRPQGRGSRVCAMAFGGAEKTQNGGCYGSTELEIVVPRRTWHKVFCGFIGKSHRRSRGGGKSENPAAVAGFSSAVGKSCLWTFPRNGFFHGPCTHRWYRAVPTPKEKAMTQKPSKPMPVLAIPKFSEGQLEPLFRRLNLAHTRSRLPGGSGSSRERKLDLSRLSRSSAGRRSGTPQANPPAALHPPGSLSLLQDH